MQQKRRHPALFQTLVEVRRIEFFDSIAFPEQPEVAVKKQQNPAVAVTRRQKAAVMRATAS